MPPHQGRLELTWTNKHLRLLAHEDGAYEWVPPEDYRVAEVRLLHDAGTVGTVAPAKQRATDNLLVRGDALNALTSLIELPEFAREYVGKVKLAYLDPPFNTQQSFLQYDDALEHSVWLTMMRDRLTQVKTLLSPEGSVWVHCDDSEQAYLKVMMDEVFGRENFVAAIVWRSADASNNDAKQFSLDHNYLVVYSQDPEWESSRLERTAASNAHYTNPDNDPRGPWFSGNVSSPRPRHNLRYDIESPTGQLLAPPSNGWRWQRETLQELIRTGEVIFSADGRRIIKKTYLADQKGLTPSTLWADLDETGHNRQAKYELKKIFNMPASELFATPKPERLIRRILEVATGPSDIVLDCFLGSGTTAAVAHKMGRRWIGAERGAGTIDTYARPRLAKVVAGEDPGGITEAVAWEGGGGFRLLDVAPSMFEPVGGQVFLNEWATNGQLAEVTAAQLHYDYQHTPPFAGRKGRTRLAVVDGLVSTGVVEVLASALAEGERLVVCGTAVDPAARERLRALRSGSTVRKIPQSILQEYRQPRRVVRQARLDEAIAAKAEAVAVADAMGTSGDG